MFEELIFKSVQKRLETQGWWLRFKGTILIVASGLAWIGISLATAPERQDAAWAATLGGVATTVAGLINRFTVDGVTPSTEQQLIEAAQSAVTTAPALEADVPTYSRGTSTPRG